MGRGLVSIRGEGGQGPLTAAIITQNTQERGNNKTKAAKNLRKRINTGQIALILFIVLSLGP